MGVDKEVQAEAWNLIFCFIKQSALGLAVELEIPDILEKHGGPLSLSELSAASGCPPSPRPTLPPHEILGLPWHLQENQRPSFAPSVNYARTSLSRFFTRDELGDYVTMQSGPPFRSPVALTGEALKTGTPLYLKSITGEDSWSDPAYIPHIRAFTNGMNAHARSTAAAIISNYPAAFDGIHSVVDVGGHHGVALGELVEAFPWVRGIVFDLPDVVADAPPLKGMEFVGGSMFESVPTADAVMLMWVLHDWGDKACVEILKKCKEAIPVERGKVMIVEAIIEEDGEGGDEFAGTRLSLDMLMMAVTAHSKERSYKEWVHLLNEAGFSRHTVKNIKTLVSVIEAYP